MTGAGATLAVTLAIQALVSMAVLAVPAMAPALAGWLKVSPTLIGAYVALVYGGAMVAIPFLCRTFINYSLPVSWRTNRTFGAN